ncbi:MAG: hypothetical protein Q8936_00625 [Bacillota bacterium]|nr:hypothetical protein [Bacillota bacterium]
MNKTEDDNADESEKSTIFQDIQLTNETILSILIFVPALILTLMSSLLTKRILVGSLNNINIEASPTPSQLSVAAGKLILIGLIVAGDVAYKRFIQKSQQNLEQNELEPYRIFLFVAVIRIIVSALALFATTEVAQISEIKITQEV